MPETLARTKELDEKLHAFLYLADEPIGGGEGPLAGLKLAIKDNIMVEGWQATAGSRILEGHIAAYDATVITRLKKAGAQLIGKTNLDDAAMGSSTESSAYGVTKNPWDLERVPGGSSGGSAAAVAADLCDAALGSDTGGSIRLPANFCGITGLKPTYGAVSRYGLIALASSLDQIGPMARSAEVVEKVFQVIAGKDQNDQTSTDYQYEPAEVDLSQLRVGLAKEHWQLDIDPEVRAANQQFVDWLKSRGATVTEVSMPSLKFALPAYYVILPAEAMANLARFDGIRYPASEKGDGTLIDRYFATKARFGREVKRRILLGTFVLSHGHYDAYYQTAVKVKNMIRREYDTTFEQVDVLISPMTLGPAFPIGSITDPLKMYQEDLLAVSANLAGIPGISVPVGFTNNNLPIGGQIVGPAFKENVLLSIAKQYQAETDWHTRKPKL